MKIEKDVGTIESVVLTTPFWFDELMRGNRDGAAILLADDAHVLHSVARGIVNTFKREVVYAKRVEV